MRLASSRLAAPVIALAVIAAGCGGSTVAFQEVPGDPPQMSVPGTAAAFAPSPTATPTSTADATTTDTAAATPTATADTGTATTTTPSTQSGTDTTAGGTTAPSTDDGTTTDQPPPAGSPAQQFEDYCASNPGAC
jgi:hypothetical protein